MQIPTNNSQAIPVHRIEIPNPFFEGNTNVYLLDTEPLTLVDTGIGTIDAFFKLTQGVEAAGHRVEAIQRIVLTHKHQDHFGLARRLREISEAEVFVHENDLEDVTHVSERLHEYVATIRRRLLMWGTPSEELEQVIDMPHQLDQLAGSTVAQPLVDGRRLACGESHLDVIHTPGHTAGSVCLLLDEYLFTGDHVLPGYTPNIGGGDIGRDGMLGQYLKSLERIATFHRPGLIVLPGHDEPIVDLTAQVQQTIAHHRDRELVILDLLRGAGPLSVYEIAVKMFSKMIGYHLVLGTGEVHAHLELMLDKHLVALDDGKYRVV